LQSSGFSGKDSLRKKTAKPAAFAQKSSHGAPRPRSRIRGSRRGARPARMRGGTAAMRRYAGEARTGARRGVRRAAARGRGRGCGEGEAGSGGTKPGHVF